MQPQSYATTAVDGGRGRIFIEVPFDPDVLWAAKTTHRVGGTVNGRRVRAVITVLGDKRGFVLGPVWTRESLIGVGDALAVVIEPEGPQRTDLAQDVAAALAADPQAATFFDSLAQFYQKAYLRWIDATVRRPEVRAERIAEVVGLLRAGIKQRPR